MTMNDTPVRTAAFGTAAVLVAGVMFALASYSNAKFEDAVITAQQEFGAHATEVAIAPSRIEVVAKRGARTAGIVQRAG